MVCERAKSAETVPIGPIARFSTTVAVGGRGSLGGGTRVLLRERLELFDQEGLGQMGVMHV